MTKPALVLAGHGSHISPHTAGLVWGYVDRLRAWGIADEITACFWKEPPAFSQVLHTIAADEVVVVPVFTVQGYFTRTVIPAEMGLAGAQTIRDGRVIHYTRTIGEHPHLAQIVRQRVTDMLQTYGLDGGQTAAAIIGHGTKRNPDSRSATREQANRLRTQNLVAQVVDVYLDDDPEIPTVYETTDAPNLIAVPYFLAPGSHVSIDLPEALGITLDERPFSVKGRSVYYTDPIGTDEAICDLILELARDTGHAFEKHPAGQVWAGFPQAGRQAFVTSIKARPMTFGQIELSAGNGRVMARHVKTGAPGRRHSSAPTGEDDAVGEYPCVLPVKNTHLHTPQALRQHMRENPLRPLPTSDDLPADWQIEVGSPEDLHAVVETIYPGAVADWALYQQGKLRIETLEAVSQRQTGMLSDSHTLTQPEKVVEAVCGHCVRHATWFYGASPADRIPCSSPCNLWLSTAKEALTQ